MTLTIADLDRAHTGGMDEIDPAARPRRRSLTAAEKLADLDSYNALAKGGPERGAFLRREGLYSSHLSEWRRQRDNGALAGLAAKPRADRQSVADVELDRSRRRVAWSVAVASVGSFESTDLGRRLVEYTLHAGAFPNEWTVPPKRSRRIAGTGYRG